MQLVFVPTMLGLICEANQQTSTPWSPQTHHEMMRGHSLLLNNAEEIGLIITLCV